MKYAKLILLVTTGFVLSACGSSEQAATTESTAGISENAAVRTITAENVQKHFEHLADDAMEGRMTGEPGYDMAAAYVAGFFEELGLTPGGDEDGDWYQEVVFQSYIIDTESATLVTHRDGVDTQLTYREDFAQYADPVREYKEIRAEVVYVGFGVHAPEFGYSDYEGIDVEGKIVAFFGGAPDVIEGTKRSYFTSARTKAREATSRGAVGFVSLRSRNSVKRFAWDRYKQIMGTRPALTWLSRTGDAAGYYAENMGSVIINTETAEELFAGTPISFEAARDAAEASTPSSTPLGFEVTIQTTSKHSETTSPNVIGIVRGTDPELADEYVVYTGHLDHVGRGREIDGDSLYNGAYDNAMGIALMMETARAFAAKPPRRSVMFIALTGEERGLLGSDFFANYPTVPVESLVANINLDMPLFLYPVADIIAYGSEHSTMLEITEKAIAREDFVLSPDPMPEQNLFARSDQFSFVRVGVPAIFLVPGHTSVDPDIDGKAIFDDHLENHYHKPSDDLSRPVDWDSAERFGRANARIGYEIANSDDRPVWNEGDFYGEKYGIKGITVANAE